MSTLIYPYCMTHEVEGDSELDRHVYEHIITECREMYANKKLVLDHQKLFGHVAYDNWNAHRDGMAHFISNHPDCKIAIKTEYGEWIDLGDGLPEGANPHSDLGLIGPPPIKIHLVSMNMDDNICEKKPGDVWYYAAPYIPEDVEEKATYLCTQCSRILKRKWRV